MDAEFQTKLIHILLFMPGFLLSLAVHESAHGYVAFLFGDNTAKKLGRITLNPFPHMTLVGTVILPIIGLFNGFLFGWGKPVPVDYKKLKNAKRDAMFIAAAGPASNLVLAVLFASVIHLYIPNVIHLVPDYLTVDQARLLMTLLFQFLFLNLALCIFNLIPIGPLDGNKIVYGLLPRPLANKFERISGALGFFILIALVFSGGLYYVIMPPIRFLAGILLGDLSIPQQITP